jgi:hypothetical protein
VGDADISPRAIALANPGLGGASYATPTLWAAILYLHPHEDAPVHRYTQHAFRFVVEGEGVWTVVDDDELDKPPPPCPGGPGGMLPLMCNSTPRHCVGWCGGPAPASRPVGQPGSVTGGLIDR